MKKKIIVLGILISLLVAVSPFNSKAECSHAWLKGNCKKYDTRQYKQCKQKKYELKNHNLSFPTTLSAEAETTANSYKRIKTGSRYLESGESVKIPFSTSNKMIFVMDLEIENCHQPVDGGVQLVLNKAGSNKKLQNDKENLEDYTYFNSWYYSNGYFQKAGKYVYSIRNTSDEDWIINYKLVGYSKIAKKASVKKKATGERGEWIKIGRVGPGYMGYGKAIKSVKFSNNNIVKYFDVCYDGTLWIKGKYAGTTRVKITLKNGKKYSTKVTFKPIDDFSFFAYIYDYKSRNNYVIVKVKNNGPKSIKFIRKGAKLRNHNYKFYDRSTKSVSSVSVKPGKTKYIKFYVKGDYLWDELENYTLYSKFKYDGRTFKWRVFTGSTGYKRGKGWYNTYYDRYDYDDWN